MRPRVRATRTARGERATYRVGPWPSGGERERYSAGRTVTTVTHDQAFGGHYVTRGHKRRPAVPQHSLPSVITYSWTHIAVSLLPEAARHWRVVSLSGMSCGRLPAHGVRGPHAGLAGVGAHARPRRLMVLPRRLLRARARARRGDARGRLRRG